MFWVVKVKVGCFKFVVCESECGVWFVNLNV